MLQTNADKLLELLRQKKRISVEDAAKTLGTSQSSIEHLSKYLEEERILKMEFSFLKPYIMLADAPASNLKEKIDVRTQAVEGLKGKIIRTQESIKPVQAPPEVVDDLPKIKTGIPELSQLKSQLASFVAESEQLQNQLASMTTLQSEHQILKESALHTSEVLSMREGEIARLKDKISAMQKDIDSERYKRVLYHVRNLNNFILTREFTLFEEDYHGLQRALKDLPEHLKEKATLKHELHRIDTEYGLLVAFQEFERQPTSHPDFHSRLDGFRQRNQELYSLYPESRELVEYLSSRLMNIACAADSDKPITTDSGITILPELQDDEPFAKPRSKAADAEEDFLEELQEDEVDAERLEQSIHEKEDAVYEDIAPVLTERSIERLEDAQAGQRLSGRLQAIADQASMLNYDLQTGTPESAVQSLVESARRKLAANDLAGVEGDYTLAREFLGRIRNFSLKKKAYSDLLALYNEVESRLEAVFAA